MSFRRTGKKKAKAPEPTTDLLGTPLAPESQPDRLLLNAVDAGFAALIFLIPFLMGGRQGLGQLTLVAAACWISLAWSLLQLRTRGARLRFSFAEPLLIAGIGLTVFQVMRLPQSMIDRLSPGIAGLLTEWGPSRLFPAWNRLSLMPAETIDSLIVLIAYAMIFVVALQRIRTNQDVYRLMTALAISVTAMAAFGLLQYATSNGRFFWFYAHPYTDTNSVVKGAFTNRNHFANFMALGIGPIIWCLARAMQNSERRDASRFSGLAMTFAVCALALVGFAGLLSLSRGGAIAMGVACVVSVIVLYRSRVLSGRISLGLSGAMVLTCGLVLAYGEGDIQKRLDDIVSADAEQLDGSSGRRAIWAANVKAIRAFPVVGTGAGSHREVYPMFMEDASADYRNEFTHAENGYLQVGMETGLTGLGLVLAGFLLAILWTFVGLGSKSSPLLAAAQAASLSGLLVSLVHSATDFVWYVPGCMVVVILLAASACRIRHLVREQAGRRTLTLPLPRFAWAAWSLAAVLLGMWMVPQKMARLTAETHWEDYLRLSLDQRGTETETDNTHVLRNRLVALSRTVAADPSLARPHTRLAALLLQAFQQLQNQSENPMSLGMIRDAAGTAGFETQQDRDDWLGRVFGARRAYLEKALSHSRASLELCPLQGQPYLYYAELTFLESPDKTVASRVVSQAELVRPYHPRVLLAAGREQLLAGDQTGGLAKWKRAFGLSKSSQVDIIHRLSVVVPAQNFIELFTPDVEALGVLGDRYRQLGRTADMQFALGKFVDACFELAADNEQPRERVLRYLLTARKVCDELGNANRALACFARAREISPREYRIYYQHGNWLAERERFEEAAAQFRICTELRPGDHYARRLLVAMQRKAIDAKLGRLPMKFASQQLLAPQQPTSADPTAPQN